MDLETEQFELDLEEKVLTVPRLGLEVSVDSFNNLTNTDNSGTIVVDSEDIPKNSCEQYHLVQTVESTLFVAADNGSELLHCKAVLVTAPNGLLGITDPVMRKATNSMGPLFRYTNQELHQLLGLYHLSNQDMIEHQAQYTRKDNEGN